jgi:hypothetical protein
MLLASPDGDPLSISPPPTSPPAADRPRPLAGRPLRTLALALAGSWALPVFATVAHADWLLPLAMLLATAGLLRAGDTLLDRLMFAATLLLGAVLALGLIYSLWPWHLDPIGIAGSYLSLTALAAALSGREFRIPTKVKASDLLLLTISAYSFYKLYEPIARLNPIQRFRFSTPLEDEITHFGFYDAIHNTGGYGFLRSSQTFPYVGHPSEMIYPQGTHFLYVLIDVFTRSTTATGNGVGEYNRFFIYTMVGFAFLVLATGWSARWLAGPLLRGWHEALVCAVVMCFAAFGPFGFVFRTADIAEVIGLAFVALLVAVVMRAPKHVPDQLLLTAAAIIGVSYAYYAFLVMILPALLVGAVVYRRRLRRHWRFATVVALVAGPIAALPMVFVEAASFNVQAQAGVAGAKADINRELLAALFVIVVASQFTRVGRRSPTWRMMSANLVLCLLGVALLIVIQGGSVTNTSYYAEKLVYVLFLMCLVGFGSFALFLRPHHELAPQSAEPKRFPARLLHHALVPSTAIGLAVLLTGAFNVGGSSEPTASNPDWLSYWSMGHVHYPDEPVLAALQQRGMLTDGVQTLVATSNYGYYDYRLSRLVGALNHKEAQTELLGTLAFSNINNINTAAEYPTGKTFRADLRLLVGQISPHSGRVRIVVANQEVANAVIAYAEQHPDLRIIVVVLPASDASVVQV